MFKKCCSMPPKEALDVERLLSWKDVRHQEDLFLDGLGSFDVSASFQETQGILNLDYDCSIFDYFACDYDHNLDDVFDKLKSCKFFSIEDEDALTEELCWQWFFSGTYAPLGSCGGGHCEMFWLPAVADLQRTAYFPHAYCKGCGCDECLDDTFRHILSGPKEDPWRRHMLQHPDYWNDPENIRALHESYSYAGYVDIDKMMAGNDLPPPEKLEEEFKRCGLK